MFHVAAEVNVAAQSADAFAQQTHLPGQNQGDEDQDRAGYDQSPRYQHEDTIPIFEKFAELGLWWGR